MPSPTVSPPASIDRTGTHDVTTALNAWLASQPNTGARLALPPDARYRCDGTLLVKDKRDLQLDAQGALVFTDLAGGRTLRNRSHWRFMRCDGITLTRAKVRGPNATPGYGSYVADLEAQHGIEAAGCKNTTVTGCDIRNVYGDGVYTGRYITSESLPFHEAANLTVENTTVDGTGRMCIGVSSIEGLTVRHNTLRRSGRSCIDLEPNTATQRISWVLVEDNDIYMQAQSGFNTLAAVGAGHIDIVVVKGNRLSGRAMGIDFRAPAQSDIRRSYLYVNDNTSAAAGGSSVGGFIRVREGDHIQVTGNVQPVQKLRTMAMVVNEGYCTDLVSTGNVLPVLESNPPKFGAQLWVKPT